MILYMVIKKPMKAAKKYDMEFIHGMELSLNYNNHQIHVVALGFDEESKAFKDFYHELRQKKTILLCICY